MGNAVEVSTIPMCAPPTPPTRRVPFGNELPCREGQNVCARCGFRMELSGAYCARLLAGTEEECIVTYEYARDELSFTGGISLQHGTVASHVNATGTTTVKPGQPMVKMFQCNFDRHKLRGRELWGGSLFPDRRIYEIENPTFCISCADSYVNYPTIPTSYQTDSKIDVCYDYLYSAVWGWVGKPWFGFERSDKVNKSMIADLVRVYNNSQTERRTNGLPDNDDVGTYLVWKCDTFFARDTKDGPRFLVPLSPENIREVQKVYGRSFSSFLGSTLSKAVIVPSRYVLKEATYG